MSNRPAPPARPLPGCAILWCRAASPLLAAVLLPLAGAALAQAPSDPMPDVSSPPSSAQPADDSTRTPRTWNADPRTPMPTPEQPSAWQRLFRRDLPAPAPNPFGLPATQAAPRAFPQASRLGSMTPGVFPLVSINGTSMRFAAGALIRGQSNMLVSPGTLSGSTWPVRYLLDPAGNVAQAWILTDAELAAEARRPRN